jgi:hypothetical protein
MKVHELQKRAPFACNQWQATSFSKTLCRVSAGHIMVCMNKIKYENKQKTLAKLQAKFNEGICLWIGTWLKYF